MAEENAIQVYDNLDKAMVEEMVANEGGGLESKGKESGVAPYLNIVQGLSNVMKSDKAEYDEKAKVGMIYNSLTGELSTEKNVLLVYYAPVWQRWKGQEALVDSYGYDDEVVKEAKMKRVQTDNGEQKRRLFPNGDRLADTRFHFCIDTDKNEPVIIAMRSTQIKKSRKWTRMLEALRVKVGDKVINPPTYMSLWNLTTTTEKNDAYGWVIKHVGFLALSQPDDMERYVMAKQLQEEIKANLDTHLGIEVPF